MSDRTAISQQDADAPQRLERGVLNVPNGIALAAAAMAPVLAVVLNAPAAAPSPGRRCRCRSCSRSSPACSSATRSSSSRGGCPRPGPSTRSTPQGLGPAAGFFTGWLFWIGYAVLAPGLFGAFGAFVHDYVLATFDADVPWWIFSLAAMAIVVRAVRAQHQGVGQHRPHPARPRGRDLPDPRRRGDRRSPAPATTRRTYFTARRPHRPASPASAWASSSASCPSSASTPPPRSARRPATRAATCRWPSPVPSASSASSTSSSCTR